MPAIAPPPQAGTSIELHADEQGHYRVEGKINGHPAIFLVDTGASSVVISRRFAQEAGIYHCTPGKRSETANGQVDVCTATGVPIVLGQFQFEDTEISIVPNMAVDALLGMSVLRRIEIRQANGVMHLTIR